MKKAFLISVSSLALSASAAFAQSPVVTDNPPAAFAGMPSTTAPALTGSDIPVGNTSYFKQIGGNNNVGALGNPLTQDADSSSGNYSEISQTQTYYYANQANSTQSAADGAQNASRISQNGTGLTANVTQYTKGNSAFTSIVEQTGSGNQATVGQGTNLVALSGGAYSSVSQSGSNGIVQVEQTSPNASSTVVQSGNGDGVTTNVSITQEGNAANNSTVWQQSNLSTANVIQNGGDGTNTSYVNQWNGSNNSATVTQTASAAGNNYSYVDQQAGATANLTQLASATANTSNIIQNGASSAYVKQGH